MKITPDTTIRQLIESIKKPNCTVTINTYSDKGYNVQVNGLLQGSNQGKVFAFLDDPDTYYEVDVERQ